MASPDSELPVAEPGEEDVLDPITNRRRDDSDEGRLVAAAAEGDLQRVRDLLDAGLAPDARDSHGYGPLHQAAAANAPGVVRLLVEAGAQMDAPDRLGWSPLAWAAFMGADSAALALLEAGADPNFWAEPAFVTALGQLMGVWHIAQDGVPGSPGVRDAERFVIAKALLEHGADPNRFRGTAPFEFALFSGRADLVALFLDHGATLEALPNPRLREHFLENPGEIGDLLRNAPEQP